jgi:hypothetical protein
MQTGDQLSIEKESEDVLWNVGNAAGGFRRAGPWQPESVE